MQSEICKESMPDTRARATTAALRAGFWILGVTLALVQAWSYRHAVTADAVMYLDLSDGSRLGQWHRLISGIWSPLYPFLLGLGLKLFHVSRYNEIVAAHLFNVCILLLTLLCFEFFLSGLKRVRRDDEAPGTDTMPDWAWIVVGYTALLWAVLTQVTFESLRPDLLMGALVFLAAGIMLRIHARGATWANMLALGAVLGAGYLAKAPMFLIAAILLGSVLLQGRRAWAKVVASGVVFTAIASLYFVPLSRQRGHFTTGDSGSFNYILHVNRAWPIWYLQNRGTAAGTFQHNPRKIFSHPDAYEFRYLQSTYPLRIDPAYWMQGIVPRFHVRSQVRTILENLGTYADTFQSAGALIAGLIVLVVLAGGIVPAMRGVLATWPLWVAGLAGMWMYLAVHAEDRYIGMFFALVFLSLLPGLRYPENLVRRVVPGVVVGVALAVFGPMILQIDHRLLAPAREEVDNQADAEAARALNRMGVKPGTEVARISPLVVDLGWARLSRVSVIAEVDISRAEAFWTLNSELQDSVLAAFRKTGARAVIARVTPGTEPSGWQQLAHSPYWLHWL